MGSRSISTSSRSQLEIPKIRKIVGIVLIIIKYQSFAKVPIHNA